MKIRHLRTKLVLVGLPILLLGALAVYAASNMFILPGFQKIENDSAIKNANRAVDALSYRITQLDQKTSDWSNWDDTYAFVNDHNKRYITDNLTDDSLTNLGINYMLFYNASNQLVEMKHVQSDSSNQQSLALDQAMKEIFRPDSPLLRYTTNSDGHKGIVDTPEGIVMIVSRPILTSMATGPSRGSIVLAESLDAPAQQELADQTQLKLTFLSASDASVTKSVPAYPSIKSKGNQWVSLLSDTQAQAFAIIPDIYGKPSLSVRVDLARTISQQGRNSMRDFMLAAFLIGLFIIIAMSLLLNRLVVDRILGLSSQLTDLKDVQDSLRAVTVRGSDELASLGIVINGLLVRLHNTQDLEQTNLTLEQKVTERTKELDGQLDQMKRTNDIMIDRELRMKELKQQNAKLREQLGDDLP
jgi:sensor domain CHASE-containing protein